MRVTEIRPNELGAPERAAWDGFLRDGVATPSGFMDWRFAQAAGVAREDARIAIVEDGAGPLAFLPYHRRPMGIARPIGAPFSDQHGPVVRPGGMLDMAHVLRALDLTAYIHSAMPDGAVRSQGPVFEAGPAWVAEFGADGAAYMAAKRAAHPSRFKGYGKRERKMQRECASVETVFDDPDPDVFARIVALKRAQFRSTGKHDVLGPAWARAMLEALRSRAHDGFGMRIVTLRLDGKMAAGEMCLLGATTLHSWLVAYDPDFSDYAPGMQLLQRVIAGAQDLGAARVDLATGHGHYKTLFADPVGNYLDGASCAAGLAGGVRRASLDLWRAVERSPAPPIASLAGKLRRRGGQIASVETDFAGRARGVIAALSAPRGAPSGPGGESA